MATKTFESLTAWSGLRKATSYRDFLQTYLEEREMTLADFARATGYGRGFPGDVITKKRRLTAKSFYAFEKALKIPAPGKKLFRLLVASEEADVHPEIERAVIKKEIAALRRKPWAPAHRQVSSHKENASQHVFKNPSALLVFAAAGQPEQGATLEELRTRTRLSEGALQSVLQDLVTARLLVWHPEKNWYEPQDLHLFFKSEDSDQIFTEIFQRACRQASARMPTALSSTQEMFFSSTFCVAEKNLPELKTALRETVLKFVDEAIQSDGDRIINLVTALHF